MTAIRDFSVHRPVRARPPVTSIVLEALDLGRFDQLGPDRGRGFGGREPLRRDGNRVRSEDASHAGSRMMLPNFLIIGAMKAGTTSLHHYLSAHPEVFMSRTKELHYFVAEKNLRRGRGWYQRQFREASEAIAVGEASTDYTKYPLFRGVPERIAGLLPDVRLIYIIRNPVERIRSHYLHDVARGRERRPIGEAVSGNEHYLAPSRYAQQIEEYLEFFPRERLLLVTSEGLRKDRRAVMHRVHNFIGVNSDWSTSVQDHEFNATGQKTAPSLLLRAARHIPGAARVRLQFPRQVIAAERLVGTTKHPVDTHAATMSDALEQELIGELAPDLARLRSHMDEDFDAWGLL